MITRREALLAGISLAPSLIATQSLLAAPPSWTKNGRVRLPDGRYVGYADYGDPAGRLVLYFHGTPGARIEAGIIAEDCKAAGLRFVGVERPGMGLSTYQSGRRILDWPRDIDCLVEALGYGGSAFGVVGMSGGGAYALACLSAMPDRITHAALISAQAPPDSGTTGNQTRTLELVNTRPRIMSFAIGRVAARFHRNPDKVAHSVTDSLAASDRKLILCDSETYAAHKQTLAEAIRCGAQGVIRDAQLLGQCWGFDLGALRPGAVSIWQGGCDPVAPPAMGHWFHRHIPGSELVVDPRAGHLTMAAWHCRDIAARFSA